MEKQFKLVNDKLKQLELSFEDEMVQQSFLTKLDNLTQDKFWNAISFVEQLKTQIV